VFNFSVRNFLLFNILLFSSISGAEIKKLKEGVYAGQVKLPSGKMLYLAIEKLNEKNINIWQKFKRDSLQLGDIYKPYSMFKLLNAIKNKEKEPKQLNNLLKKHCLDEKESKQYIEAMESRSEKLSKIFKWEIHGGITTQMSDWDQMPYAYMIYASSDPMAK